MKEDLAKSEGISKEKVLENSDLSEENAVPKFDGGYKQELSKKKQFIHFMQKYARAEWCNTLSPDQVELCDREFLLEDYQKRQADLVYKIYLNGKEFYVYLIMELQSKVDYTMPFRLLTLLYALLLRIFLHTSKKERERKDFKLPVVIPVLFYNGTGKWTVDTHFRNYLHESQLFEDYPLDFRYYLVDLSQIENDYILNSNTLLDNILALDKNRKENTMPDMLELILERMKRLDKNEYIDFRKWLENILLASVRGKSKETVAKLINALQKGDEEMIHGLQLTIMEQYDKGMEAGMEKGELCSLIKMVCRKLIKGKSRSQIAEELEEDLTVIERICDAAAKFAPDYDCERIYDKLKEASASE